MSYKNGKNIDVKSAFLGPMAENNEILEELIIDSLRDYIYWRRNIHPEDSPSISENDKIQPLYIHTKSVMRQELFNILAELKKGAPIYSKRYFGHILGDLFIPSMVGYFAAMLYNQNNVVAEVSPVTIEKELNYIKEISKMLSYPILDYDKLSSSPKDTSWGHLSAGGTTANLEAIWVARNIKYFPLSVRLLSKTNKKYKLLESLEIQTPNGQIARLKDIGPFQLLSLKSKDVLGLILKIEKTLIQGQLGKNAMLDFENQMPTIQKLGLINFYQECKDRHLDFKLPKVIIPQTVHYCWFKSMDILGVGNKNLTQIPVDYSFKMKVDILQEEISNATQNEVPILALIGICGTTEEGAVDPLSHMARIKTNTEKKQNVSFWFHSDAAIGGYFAALLKDKNFHDTSTKGMVDIKALRECDSIVVDPHKLGYIPYPAGAVIFKDSRIREHITYKAPYLNESEYIMKTFIGKWTLEGSRPGASAISCYLSQHTFPLNREGYGQILDGCMKVRDKLLLAFDDVNRNPEKNRGFQIKLLYKPQLNIICYTVCSPKYLKTPECLNEMTNKIYNKLSVAGNLHASSYEYLVSKTDYSFKDYKQIIDNYLSGMNIRDRMLGGDYRLVALRSVLMNPMVDDDVILNGFAQYLCKVAEELLPEVQIENLIKTNNNMRLRIAVAEDNDVDCSSLRYHLEFDQTLSKGLEIRAISDVNEFDEIFRAYKPHVVITDIKFNNNLFAGIELIKYLKGRKNREKQFKNIIVYSANLENDAVARELSGLGIPARHRISKSYDYIKDSRAILNTIMESFM